MAAVEHLVLRLIESARGRAVVALLLIAIGTLFCRIAWRDFRDARRLQASRAEVDAEVVDTRARTDQHFNINYDLRYRFRIPADAAWHTRQERGTGRSDLWSTLKKPEWERACANGTVRVVYVPEDPGVNRPVSVEAQANSDATAGLVLGAACLVGGVLWLAWLAATAALRDRGMAKAPIGATRSSSGRQPSTFKPAS